MEVLSKSTIKRGTFGIRQVADAVLTSQIISHLLATVSNLLPRPQKYIYGSKMVTSGTKLHSSVDFFDGRVQFASRGPSTAN